MQTPVKHNLGKAALLIVVAGLMVAILNALQKGLHGRVPLLELLFFRNLLSLPIVLLAGLRRGVVLRTRHFGGHVIRSTSGLISMGMSLVAVSMLPLAEQQALSYTQPLFIIVLAMPLLGERPGARRWTSVLVGFLGVLVIGLGAAMDQGGGGHAGAVPGWAYAVAIGQGLFAAFTTLQIRQLSATEASSTITLWQAILMTAATAAALPFAWVMPGPADLAMLVVIGTFAGLSQLLQTEAFASAQVSAIGPYTYTGLIWAAIIGFAAFGDVPGPAMIAGALLIVGAGIWMLRGERRAGTRPPAPSHRGWRSRCAAVLRPMRD